MKTHDYFLDFKNELNTFVTANSLYNYIQQIIAYFMKKKKYRNEQLL